MRTIDEDRLGEICLGQEGLGLGDVRGRVVGARGAAAEDDVAVGIAARDDGGRGAVEVDAEKGLRLAGGPDGVDGGLQGTVGAVLETERHREAGGHLPVSLRLRGAGSDGSPADEVGDVLGCDGIEKLGGRGQTEVEDVAEKCAPEAEAVGDVVGAIEVRVHDEAFPADGGAGLLEINAHYDYDAVGDFAGEGGEAAGVVAAGVEVVDRAGADEQEEAPVVGEDDAANVLAAVGDKGGLSGGFGQLGQQRGGRGQGAGFDDVEVGGAVHEVPAWALRANGCKSALE